MIPEQIKKKQGVINMEKFKMVSKIIDETFNCSAALHAYESPARKTKDYVNKKYNWDKMLKGQGISKKIK